MKRSNITGILFITGIILSSCTKVINVNLNDSSPQIVIEGNITNSTGPYQVKITKTVNFSASNIFPPVSGAFVKITDSTSSTADTLTETSPGIYTTHSINGITGHTYNLYVLAQGKIYTSSSKMPATVPLDSISFQHDNRFGTSYIEPVVYFQDPAGIANYYTFTEFVNNRRMSDPFIFDDRLSDGKYISQQLYSDSSHVHVGDTLRILMYCVDKNVWNYFNTLIQATSNNVQALSPSNPISNISDNALGYFSAAAIVSKQRIAN